MASYLRPRRGKKATARTTLSGTNVLKKGEIFFEVNDNGPGGGQGRIMMGDGSSNYTALTTKYFLDFDSAKVAFTNVSSSANSAIALGSGYLSSINGGNTLAGCLQNIKQCLANLQAQVTALNNDKMQISPISTIYNNGAVTLPVNETKQIILTKATQVGDLLLFVFRYSTVNRRYTVPIYLNTLASNYSIIIGACDEVVATCRNEAKMDLAHYSEATGGIPNLVIDYVYLWNR